jgi:NTP pyrophosphatase (non-canonical NTP hydrolase)
MKTPTQLLMEFDQTQPIPEPVPHSQKNIQRLLDKLQEESAEVIQAISKVRRFGEHNRHPDRTTTNHEELLQELTDFLAIVAALEQLEYCNLTIHQHSIFRKTQQLISS